jgi:predicted transcriptional regulator
MENLIYADTLLQSKVQKISKIDTGCRLCGRNVCEHIESKTELASLLDPNIRYNGLFEFNN